MEQSAKSPEFVSVADVEITTVTPDRAGFTIEGIAADRSDYRFRLDLEVPIDQRTRSVVGEMLSQSKWRILRRSAPARTGSDRAVSYQPKPAKS